jgi:hypothetical protein
MNIGIVCWNIDVNKYFEATCDSILSVYNEKNRVLIVVQRSSAEACSRIHDKYPRVEILNDCPWGNNQSSSMNYIIKKFIDEHGYCVVQSNDVVVCDGYFSWFNKEELVNKGIIYPVDVNHEPELPYSCFIIFEWLYDKIGEFDELFSVADNDNDYMLRMKKLGMEGYYHPNFTIDHIGRMSLDDLRHAKGTKFAEEFDRLLKISEDHFTKKWNDVL